MSGRTSKAVTLERSWAKSAKVRCAKGNNNFPVAVSSIPFVVRMNSVVPKSSSN